MRKNEGRATKGENKMMLALKEGMLENEDLEIFATRADLDQPASRSGLSDLRKNVQTSAREVMRVKAELDILKTMKGSIAASSMLSTEAGSAGWGGGAPLGMGFGSGTNGNSGSGKGTKRDTAATYEELQTSVSDIRARLSSSVLDCLDCANFHESRT